LHIDNESRELVIHGDLKIIEDILSMVYEKFATKIKLEPSLLFNDITMSQSQNLGANFLNDSQEIHNLTKLLDTSKLIKRSLPSVNRSSNKGSDISGMIGRSRYDEFGLSIESKQ
jgi:hypothetical protein